MKYYLQLALAGISTAAFAQSPAGAVFIMNNSPVKNQIVQYNRASDGTLQQFASFPTGGRGSGGATDPLASQGSLVLSSNNSLLFAVNAGSGDIAAFEVYPFGLELIGTTPSGGSSPVALAQWGNWLYVVNSSGTSNVTGFLVNPSGGLAPIPNSTTYLSTGTSGAASVAFSSDGKFLAVTERLTNKVDTFSVQPNGTLSAIVENASTDPGVFSVLFAPGDLAVVVSTGPAGATNGSLLSSYTIGASGTLTAVTSSVGTLGAASCWNVVTPDGRFVYTSNAGTGTISGFALGAGGTLTALPGTIAATNPSGSTNIDIAISADGKFLYTLNVGTGVIAIFAVNTNGALTPVGTAPGVGTAGFNGIAAY